MLHPDVKQRWIGQRIEESAYGARVTKFTKATAPTLLLTHEHSHLLDLNTASRIEISERGDLDSASTQHQQQQQEQQQQQQEQGEDSQPQKRAKVGAFAASQCDGDEAEVRLCRATAQHNAWFESTLGVDGIFERFELALEDYKDTEPALTYKRHERKHNVLQVTLPDPHVGLETRDDIVFSIRATPRAGRTTIVEFMLNKGSGMHFKKVTADLRSYAGDMMSTCAKPSQLGPTPSLC